MIQKQVLKMHKRQNQEENPEQINRFSVGSKNSKSPESLTKVRLRNIIS